MPSQFLPRKSFAHRVACKALYRALLRPCPHIPLPPDLPTRGSINPIKHLVRKRFRQYVYTTSEKMVVKALSVGYAVENLLRDAANGNEKALSQTHSLLKSLHEQYLRAKSSTPLPLPNPIARPPRPIPFPGAPKTIDIRPLPQSALGGKGRRLIPKFVTTGSSQNDGIAFIRFKRPQSAYLSRVVRQKMEAKERRWAAKDRGEECVEWGVGEATWERLVLGQIRKEWGRIDLNERVEEDGEDDDGETVRGENGRLWEFDDWGDRNSWISASVKAIEDIKKSIHRENRARAGMGLKWMDIISQEKQLREKEERERRHKVRVEKNVRKWGFDRGEKEVEEMKEIAEKVEEREVKLKEDKVASCRPLGQSNVERVTGPSKKNDGRSRQQMKSKKV